MTATDELRRMLDERGVEWTANDGEHVKETCWPYMGELTAAFAEYDNGTTRFACDTWCFTPEQAVAATLGREPDDAAMVRLHDQMNAAMLKYEMAQGIEKRDGDEAIVVPWVAKMHALLEEAATLGAGTCKARLYKPEYGLSDCTICECGEINDISANYCNKCGRLIEVLSE